jgi:sec-independent protein translocase protein TatA
MIPGVPTMGGTELLIILAIILLFFGAKRVPELGRSLGRGMRELRKGASEDPDDRTETHGRVESSELPREAEEAAPDKARAQTELQQEQTRQG